MDMDDMDDMHSRRFLSTPYASVAEIPLIRNTGTVPT